MTTDRATLLGLADRCEKAGGPDGVLDRDIALAAGWRPANSQSSRPGQESVCVTRKKTYPQRQCKMKQQTETAISSIFSHLGMPIYLSISVCIY